MRNVSWVIPKNALLKEVLAATQAKPKKNLVRGCEEPARTTVAEALEVALQHSIELVAVRINRLDQVESELEPTAAQPYFCLNKPTEGKPWPISPISAPCSSTPR